MQYMKLNTIEREELLASLDEMPEFLQSTFARLSAERILTRGPEETFSPVEQVWHLADLEREGFGRRIRRLLTECEPHLPDFDGERVAAERNYRGLSLNEGLRAFAEARQKNIELLRTIETERWFLSGTQEGIGKVSLCDIPGFMLQHDTAHRIEIEEWKRFVG